MCRGEILLFGEAALLKAPEAHTRQISAKAARNSMFVKDIWVGKHRESDDHLCPTAAAPHRARTARRLESLRRANTRLLAKVWHTDRGLDVQRNAENITKCQRALGICDKTGCVRVGCINRSTNECTWRLVAAATAEMKIPMEMDQGRPFHNDPPMKSEGPPRDVWAPDALRT